MVHFKIHMSMMAAHMTMMTGKFFIIQKISKFIFKIINRKYKDVFDVQVYTDKAPKLRLEYGAPFFHAAARS